MARNVSDHFHPHQDNTRTAFGEVSVAELTPQVQMQWPYNINSRITEARANQSGIVDSASRMLRLQTGAAANSSGTALSVGRPVYPPGQGVIARFTTLYTTGVSGSHQWVGIGDEGDGFFFGFEGAAFGLVRRQGGCAEIRTFTVTVASDTAEDITITLDGDAKTDVAITNAAGDETITANEIAAADYSDVGRGWSAHAVSDTVVFLSWDGAPHTGTYSLTGAAGTAAATIAQTVAGITPTETFVAQADWNEDVADGTMMLPPLDQTLGNVYQIRYQWLGFGAVSFSIEDPLTGELVLVHRLRFANTSSAPSVDNPSLPMSAQVENAANTSNITLRSGSMAGFTEGRRVRLGPRHSVEAGSIVITTAELPILSVMNKSDYQGTLNRTISQVEHYHVASDASAIIIVRVRLSAALVGASFSDVDTDTSPLSKDTSATAVTGGVLIEQFVLGRTDSFEFDAQGFDLLPGESLTMTAEAANGANQGAIFSLDMRDEF